MVIFSAILGPFSGLIKPLFSLFLCLFLSLFLSPFPSLFEAPNRQLGKVKKRSFYWEKGHLRVQLEVILALIFPHNSAYLTSKMTPKPPQKA